jgi:hypothetical protein
MSEPEPPTDPSAQADDQYEDQAQGDPTRSDEAVDELPEAPAEVAELARACVEYVKRSTGIELDYTAETLPVLDHYVREARSQIAGRPELLDAVAAPIGAYLGEVARRRLPLSWFAPPGEYRRFRIELTRAFVSMNPIGAAVEALELQDVEGWGAHLRMRPEDRGRAEAALARLPELELEDYFALSSRLETLEIVVDAILAGVSDPPTYGPEDYGPFRAEAIGEALDGGAGTH